MRNIALDRAPGPEDVAAGIANLASDETRFATGSALTIDGGVSAA
jgi:NAD(P)-dependent dehydrogenase (short-subunit alcohol dehydrogenase family)